MKKYILYIGILIGGILLGYFFFGSSEESKVSETHEHQTEAEETQMWTCSMHPQIMQPEPGDCPICGMELIPADASDSGLSKDQFRMSETALALADIQTTVVGNSSAGENTLRLSGKIRENEEENSVQASYFAGRIERLHINSTGEQVNQGQLLATIYSPELISAQQELLTAATSKQSQPRLYNAVRNKLKSWKLSDTQINSIENSGEVRENFPVYANVSGTVTQKLVQEGDYVQRGQALLRIANLNTVWAVFDAYENQLEVLKEGQKITISANSFPNQEFEASISFINPVLNTSTRTVSVRAELDNRDNMLKPGMFVEGTIEGISADSEESLIIPKSAVLWTGERSLVYVKTNPQQPIFEMREVTLGAESENSYHILKGLKAGDEIVSNGTFTVDAAAQLQGKKSMMNNNKMALADDSMPMDLPESFQQNFIPVLDAYFALKDAFIDADVKAVQEDALSMLEKVQEINKSELGKMTNQHLSKVSEMLEAISENEDIENQREHLVVLSENMIAISSNLTNLKQPVYVQHCPMANNDKGADWLSLSSEIENPYFGSSMLNCGEVIREL